MRVHAIALAAALALSCGGSDSGSSSSTSSTSSSSSSSGGTDGSAASICVDTINSFRATQNLPPLARWSDEESCADGEAKSDGLTSLPHGAFGRCNEFSQNECPGWGGPADQGITGCLKAMWDQPVGEGHHDNMASTKWTKVACGFYTLPSGDFWSVQNFR